MSRAGLQARAYYRRERVRSLRTTTARMGRTHVIARPEGSINTAQLFTYEERSAPVAFACDLRLESSSGHGLIFAFGGFYQGVAVWIKPNGVINYAVGSPKVLTFVEPPIRPPQYDIYDQSFTFGSSDPGAIPVGMQTRVAFACRPGDGTARLWVNGNLIKRSRSNFGNFDRGSGDGNLWANDESGTYFKPPTASIVTCDELGIPFDMTPLSGLSIYHDQRPQHYNTGPQDPNIEELAP